MENVALKIPGRENSNLFLPCVFEQANKKTIFSWPPMPYAAHFCVGSSVALGVLFLY